MEEARPEPTSEAIAISPAEVILPAKDPASASISPDSVPAGPGVQTADASIQSEPPKANTASQIPPGPVLEITATPVPLPSPLPTAADQDANHRLAEETLNLARATRLAAWSSVSVAIATIVLAILTGIQLASLKKDASNFADVLQQTNKALALLEKQTEQSGQLVAEVKKTAPEIRERLPSPILPLTLSPLTGCQIEQTGEQYRLLNAASCYFINIPVESTSKVPVRIGAALEFPHQGRPWSCPAEESQSLTTPGSTSLSIDVAKCFRINQVRRIGEFNFNVITNQEKL
ncbi:MAG: hypothetical protein ABUT39_11560 [Acidobacteriota bacterium]